ncbi:MAG: DUF4339 domain-containing protein [Verrucomicrobia bacterium]|nr:DUF4339 domain-containing protein [Verrucomicrobiota bacterium]
MSTNPSSWYFAEGDQHRGPVTFDHIQQAVATGQLPPHTLVWSEGMTHWLPYHALPAPASTSLPQGPASGPDPAFPLPIPFHLKRASFPKLMLISGIGLTLFALGMANTYYLGRGLSPLPSDGRWALIIGLLLMLCSLGVLLYALMLSLVCVYRAWLMLQAFGASVTPGIAVGFQFIPFFSLYWNFRAYYLWSRDYNRTIRAEPRLHQAPPVTEGLFLTYCIGLAIVGILDFHEYLPLPHRLGSVAAVSGTLTVVAIISYFVMIAQMCSAVNFFVDLRDREALQRELSR